MIKHAALVLALSQALMFGQGTSKSPAAAERVTKVVRVRYARAEAVKDLIEIGGVNCRANNGLKMLVLDGTQSEVASAEQAVKELDVPPASELARNVEVTIYVIGAASRGPSETAPVAEIEPVLRQLKAVFPYDSYQLLDSMMIRLREGSMAHSDGLLKTFPSAQPASLNPYTVHCTLGARSDTDSDRTVRFNKFIFQTGVPLKSDVRVSMDTNFDVQNGQKVVVGNTDVDAGNAALFVVVSAKFVQ